MSLSIPISHNFSGFHFLAPFPFLVGIPINEFGVHVIADFQVTPGCSARIGNLCVKAIVAKKIARFGDRILKFGRSRKRYSLDRSVQCI
jgi:hypothetical protein